MPIKLNSNKTNNYTNLIFYTKKKSFCWIEFY